MKFLKLNNDLEVEAVFSGLCLLIQEVAAQRGPAHHIDLINRLLEQVAALNHTRVGKGLSLVPNAPVTPFAVDGSNTPKDIA